jgi:hypothetical protein
VVDLGAIWRWLSGAEASAPPAKDDLERPWLRCWDHLPKRSAGPDFSRTDYKEARARAAEVARATLGPRLLEQLDRQGTSICPLTASMV